MPTYEAILKRTVRTARTVRVEADSVSDVWFKIKATGEAIVFDQFPEVSGSPAVDRVRLMSVRKAKTK